MPTPRPRHSLLLLILACASILLLPIVSAATSCTTTSACAVGTSCTQLRASTDGFCAVRGLILSSCTQTDDCLTHQGEQLTCRTLGDMITGTYCALPGAQPVPPSMQCDTGSTPSDCAADESCVATSVSFGSKGICVPGVEPTLPACTVGGIPCEGGRVCSAELATIGAIGVCVEPSSTGASSSPAPATVDNSQDWGAYCMCLCNGMLVPGYGSYLTESCSKCNSACWSAVFSLCGTGTMRGVVTGVCTKDLTQDDQSGDDGGDSGNKDPVPTGGACDDDTPCATGDVCTPRDSGSGGTCVASGERGAACWKGNLCNTSNGVLLVCLAGRCSPDDGTGGMNEQLQDGPPAVTPVVKNALGGAASITSSPVVTATLLIVAVIGMRQ